MKTLKKKQILVMFVFIAFGWQSLYAQDPITLNKPALKAIYGEPATDWSATKESETFLTIPQPIPIGNGFLGGMVYGGIPHDIVQMNEHSLWSGGPGKNVNFNGGHNNFTNPGINHQNLQSARRKIQEDINQFSSTKAARIDAGTGRVITSDFTESSQARDFVNTLKGNKSDFGSYQTLGNLNIADLGSLPPFLLDVTSDADPDNGEKSVLLFDGNTRTKWYSGSGFKSFPCYITWGYDVPITINKYSMTSANDVPGRDPRAWSLYGSNTGNADDYTLIKTESNVVFAERYQTLTFNIGSTVTYKYFKIVITATQANNPPQLSEITMESVNAPQVPQYSNYSRELNLDNAVVTVNYTQNNTNYSREYFTNNPNNVMVVRLKANEAAKLSKVIWLTSLQTKKTTTAENGIITMTGQPADQTVNGLKFAQQVKVIPSGGTMSVAYDKIQVEGADEILIITTAATNYEQCMDNTFNYFSSTDPLTTVTNTLNAAVQKGYSTLLSEHVADYQSLYNRMGLSLGNNIQVPAKATNQLLLDYQKNTITNAEKLYLEMLYYQFGRYLLISSSRKNSLPANLQGIWADELNPPWAADYHTNINVQMNYWLAEQTNLAECHTPVIKYTQSLVPRGRITAQTYHCKPDGGPVRGWAIYHENSVWGNTGPGNSDAYYFPAAAAWMCQDIWEHYCFNSDKQFLQDNYEILQDAALFWVDNLWRDTRDGTLVANPSYSPEHGPYTVAASCDQAIIWEIFDIVIKASEILDKSTPEVAEIKAALSKLAGPQIGLNGQFMEWKDETTRDVNGGGGHRHANHLFWLHPGSQIIAGRSVQDDLFVEAMKKTLNTRGDGDRKSTRLNSSHT